MCELKIKIFGGLSFFRFSSSASGNGVSLHPTPDSKTYSILIGVESWLGHSNPSTSRGGRKPPLAESPVVDITWFSRSSFKRALGFMEFGCLFLRVEND